MRAAGTIVGLLVLGSFMIPSGYRLNTRAVGGFLGAIGEAAKPVEDGSQGTATLTGRVFDEAGGPVDGAIVSLAGSGFWPAKTINSDAEGRFAWPRIPAGVYELRVSKGPLVAPPVEGLILDAGGRRAFGIQLARGWSMRGLVVDGTTDEPVGGAEVTVATGALGLHTRSARSTADGRFEVVGVVGSEQNLYVDADGYVLAGPVVHREGDPPVVIRLDRGARIVGRVVDVDGRPVVDASVRAFGAQAAVRQEGESLGVTAGPVPPISFAAKSGLAFVTEALSGADGEFALEDLRPGAYTVVASHEDYAPSASQRLNLGAGERGGAVELVMLPGAELVGRVVDERGRGLESIPVELRAKDERLPRMIVTDDRGRFSFRGVRGEVSVTALPYDLPAVREVVTVTGDDRITVELALSTSLETLRGRVVDERGFGISGALLTVTSEDPASPVKRSAKSDDDGSFSVPALPAPPYSVNVEHPAFSRTKMKAIDETEDLEVVMITGVTLLGEVLDGWTGEGLGGVRVRLSGEQDAQTRTRADGTFVLRQLPTGTYDVSLEHVDYENQSQRVVLEPPRYVDRPQELETVRLEPGGAIEGEVMDADQNPVAGAEVTWGEPPRWGEATRTDGRGQFRLRGVPEGVFWVTARHGRAGEDTSQEPVAVRPLETSPGVLIRLPDSSEE